MDSNRKTALTAGILFIVATVASLLGTAIEQPVLSGTDYLARVAANANQITAGVLVEVIAAFACAGIAITLYPVLKNWSVGLALGSVAFRTIEAVVYTVAAGTLLALLTLSQQFVRSAATDHPSFQAIGGALLGVREEVTFAGVLAFSVGALMYYILFYQSRLIPRWLSGWGIAAIILLMGAWLVALFSHHPLTTYIITVLPIAVQEMVLAVWLILKGFTKSALRPSAVQTESHALAS